MSSTFGKSIDEFVKGPFDSHSLIDCERALQLELALFFSTKNCKIGFEKKILTPRIDTSYNRPKSRLDLLIHQNGKQIALELKLPMNGRHPETLYDFCKDIEFVESIIRHGHADEGYCLLMTNDHVFWEDSGRGSQIHDYFRSNEIECTGRINKPTGQTASHVHLTGSYFLSRYWCNVPALGPMNNARYLLLKVDP